MHSGIVDAETVDTGKIVDGAGGGDSTIASQHPATNRIQFSGSHTGANVGFHFVPRQSDNSADFEHHAEVVFGFEGHRLLCWIEDGLQVGGLIVAEEAPCFTGWMGDIVKMGNAGIVGAHFAMPPGANVEDVVEADFDDAAVTKNEHGVVAMALNEFFDEDADAGAEVHQTFTVVIEGDGGEGFFTAPNVTVFG